MNFGFLINNRTCIGCHACSTACKSENEVPLGVYRTWVKYVETGSYPDSRRHFQVTRCNHCANPPCVRICPVTAMYQRTDGIVEFDAEQCIGCKACMQACPYDAIYIDPDSGTAAKCHYCSHRTDIGLEPACVVVCPEHAIISGDLDDPASEISRMIAREQVSVRKPEQGTAPKVFYIDGHDVSLYPTAAESVSENFMWSDTISSDAISERQSSSLRNDSQSRPRGMSPGGTEIYEPQNIPTRPIQLGQRMAEHMVQVGYNAQHHVPWHWPVPAYLVTKSIGTGAFLLYALAWFFGLVHQGSLASLLISVSSLFFIAVTTALLVFDLERPERFLRILFMPQWKSWLTRGAFILVAFTGILGSWFFLEILYFIGYFPLLLDTIRSWIFGLGIPLAIGSAIYTAYLFGQAEGRDLWQSSLLPFHLFIQSLMAGSALLCILGTLIELPFGFAIFSQVVLVLMLIVDLFLLLFGEFGMRHASEIASRAAHDIRDGQYRYYFRFSLVFGHTLPLLLVLFSSNSFLIGSAGLLILLGLYAFEYAFVMAPQKISNS